MPNPEFIHLIALISTIVFLFAAIRNKVYLASAYLVLIMTKPGLYYPFIAQIRFELIVAIIALLSILFAADKTELLKASRSKILLWMSLFLCVIFISMIQAFDIQRSWSRIYDEILPNTILIMLLLVLCRNKKDVKIFLWTFVFATAWIGYEPIYRYFAGDVVESYESFDYAVASQGLAEMHTSLAHYLLQGMVFLWYLAITAENRLEKLGAFGLFAFCFLGVVISGSRGGLVGLAILFFFLAIFSTHPVIVMALGGIAIAVTLSTMGGGYIERMASILELGSSDLSASSRISGLYHGIEMMIKRPILGVGPGCYPLARKIYFNWSLWSHNHYGQLAGELGVLGVIVWFKFAHEYIKNSWTIRKLSTIDPWIRQMATAILVTTAVRLSLGMFDHSLYKFIWYIMAAIVIILEELNINIGDTESVV